jgi:MFS family permease
MVVLDATIVNIALPSAQQALNFSTESRQWVITAYALAFGSLLLLGGKLGDLFGRKWTFIGGLLFVVGLVVALVVLPSRGASASAVSGAVPATE